MRKKILPLLVLAILTTTSYSQHRPSLSWKISDFQVSTGMENSTSAFSIRPNEFTRFAPGSSIISPGGADPYGFGFPYDWSSSMLNIHLGLNPFNKSTGETRLNRTLRLGLSAQQFSNNLYSTFNGSTTRVDTLLNGNNSSIFGFVDSVRYENTYSDYSATALKLDAAFLWSTDGSRRVSLFAGLGVNAGLLVAAQTYIHSHEWTERQITDSTGYPISFTNFNGDRFDSREERFNNKTGWAGTAYIPFGVDFRIGKKHSFWKQLHLFTEVRPALSFVSIPETKTVLIPGVQNTFGLKVRW